MTRKEKRTWLRKVEAEYARALAEIRNSPGGNGFATQKEMSEEVGRLYGSTIASLRRQLGIY